MKLTLEGIKDRAAWQSAGIKLPDYDVQEVSEKAKKHPVWAHFGAGNIFRIFVGGMADAMLEKGLWTGDSPVWRPLISTWWIRFIRRMTTLCWPLR